MPQPSKRLAADDAEREIESLRSRLEHTGELVTEVVAIPGTEIAVTVTRPVDTDRLLDQIAHDPEQNLPYWAEIWPSGIALAADIARHPERIRGRRVLELGSGVGITAAVAVQHGAHLTVTDYAPESLLLTEMTVRRHTGEAPASIRQMNWRGSDVDTISREGRFDVVLGADLLYERRDIEPLVAAIETLLLPDGALWLAEPGRKPALDFLEAMRGRDWRLASTVWEGPWPDPKDAGTTARTHWMQRPRN
jgi:predicted nicotinamide N-methyase